MTGWNETKLRALAAPRKQPNLGMLETNVLSLSYGRVVRRDVTRNEGLLPASFDTYQIVEAGDTVVRPTDLQNDQRSIRTGYATERGIITSAYIVLRPIDIEPAFLSYLLRAIDASKELYRLGGGLRQTLTFADLRDLRVQVPDSETQRALVRYLDFQLAEMDAAIADARRMVDLTIERKASLVATVATGAWAPLEGSAELTVPHEVVRPEGGSLVGSS